MKKLGFGLMRLPLLDPSDVTSIDMEQMEKMVDLFMEKGFTYFDTAWLYRGFKSEIATKTALVERYPRESFQLATKLHADFFNTLPERDEIFNEQLRKTGAGYFDKYLLHGVDSQKIEKLERLDCFNWLLEKKEKGLIKQIGFSYHYNAELLDKILTDHPEMEFVQLQINYLDWESPWIQSRANYEVCLKHNKPVIVMEPVKGGSLAAVPEEAEKLFRDADPNMSVSSWGIRFAASLPNVEVVLSGMSDMEQMKNNISYMEDFKPLTKEETELCFKVAEIINAQIAVPCTGCEYCAKGCPQNIAIPQFFSLYNELMREDMKKKGWTQSFSRYSLLTEKFGKAADCIACGQCESICPQHLTVIEYLKQVSSRFDKR